ncbi:GntR family transcriptional regulator [Amycolatopsis acidicola]|uniref:GntR family transcriptional regulator n=1 Tax=Amycolatopsis acidicola TaxID=2596893 RepID=A0A5N0VKK8_9PSEU|nr:GntR family transcriptional regulator [Amycolatopsis acidicola]KAA9166043.1 GntR family transcriptional regulator [Amycolatopsis acidicola]
MEVNEGTGAVQRAAAAIRDLVMHRKLVPGQQVRQEDLSRQIGISRGPIREALRILRQDGVVAYERHRGYFVTQFSADEMNQLYLARDLLETAVLAKLPAPSEESLAELAAINESVRSAGTGVDLVMRENDRFHAGVLALSAQRLLVEEIDRIWRMSVAYRALSVSVLSDAAVLAEDHDGMLDALRAGDGKRLAGAVARPSSGLVEPSIADFALISTSSLRVDICAPTSALKWLTVFEPTDGVLERVVSPS